MPSSNGNQINEILELMILTDPHVLLDIGAGFGKYGFLAREYLELWDGNENYHQRTRKIIGIEAFADYLTPVHDFIYDEVHTGDALEICPTLDETIDLVLMIDVFEHFERKQGMELLACLRGKARNILISVPRDLDDQGDAFGNPYEIHRYGWRKEDFRDFPQKFFTGTEDSLFCFMGEDAARVQAEMKRRHYRSFVRRRLPFLVKMRQLLR